VRGSSSHKVLSLYTTCSSSQSRETVPLSLVSSNKCTLYVKIVNSVHSIKIVFIVYVTTDLNILCASVLFCFIFIMLLCPTLFNSCQLYLSRVKKAYDVLTHSLKNFLKF
jgi:hypothetical protein